MTLTMQTRYLQLAYEAMSQGDYEKARYYGRKAVPAPSPRYYGLPRDTWDMDAWRYNHMGLQHPLDGPKYLPKKEQQ